MLYFALAAFSKHFALKIGIELQRNRKHKQQFFFRITILNPFYFYYYMTIRTVRVSLSLLHLNLSLFILNSRAPANDSNHTLNRWCVCICYIYMCTDFDRRCVTHTNAVTLVSTEIHFAYPLDIWLWMHLMADIYIIIELLWNYFMHFI